MGADFLWYFIVTEPRATAMNSFDNHKVLVDVDTYSGTQFNADSDAVVDTHAAKPPRSVSDDSGHFCHVPIIIRPPGLQSS